MPRASPRPCQRACDDVDEVRVAAYRRRTDATTNASGMADSTRLLIADFEGLHGALLADMGSSKGSFLPDPDQGQCSEH